jgi:hypothetical protein
MGCGWGFGGSSLIAHSNWEPEKENGGELYGLSAIFTFMNFYRLDDYLRYQPALTGIAISIGVDKSGFIEVSPQPIVVAPTANATAKAGITRRIVLYNFFMLFSPPFLKEVRFESWTVDSPRSAEDARGSEAWKSRIF